MSVKKNIVANYIGQFYATLVSIVMVPIYLHFMGAESYGLIGFFVLMQSWFQLLDLGLSPTLGREVARFRGSTLSSEGLWRLLRAMEGVFIVVAIAGAAGIAALSGVIANEWLNVKTLPLREVSNALTLMGVSVALRWVCGIYRSAIWGFERQVWLNIFTIVIATLRFVTVIPVFLFVGTSLKVFFIYQLAVSVIELGCLAVGAYRTMPDVAGRVAWSIAPLREVAGFSLTIAFTASVWVMVTQTDKLVLSKILSLDAFGYFTLGVLVAGAVNLVGMPIVQAMLPRLAKLAAERDEVELLSLYRHATQWVSGVAAPVALGLALFAEPILWVWTGNSETASAVAPILALYAIGNGLLAVAAFQYYLQYAKGDLRLHLAGNLVFVVILVPLLIWAATRFGAIGAGFVWVGQCAAYLLAWTAVVHQRFIPGQHWLWLLSDVAPAWLVVVALGAALHGVVRLADTTRLGAAAELFAIGSVLLASGLVTSKSVRSKLFGSIRARGAIGP